MLAEAHHRAHAHVARPTPALVLDHHRMLELTAPRSPRMPRSPRLGKAGSTANSSAGVRPAFDFVRTAGGRPLSLPYSMDHAGVQAGLRCLHGRPSPPPSLLDSLSLAEDADDQDPSPAASLLDSPRLTPVSSLMDSSSLARMARMRQPAMLDSYQALPAIKRGVLWQQRERLWSRWKERYFVLTSDYLHCFKRRSAGDGLSQMGHFIFKIRLVDLDAVEWVNRRSYSVVALSTRDRPRVLLRASQGLEDWFELLEECTIASKERRRALYARRTPACDWGGSLQREGSLSMSPGVEVLLRRRLEEQEAQREREDQWGPPGSPGPPGPPPSQRKQTMLRDLEDPPPSAPATFRSPARAAGRGYLGGGPPPSVPPPSPPAAPCYEPPPAPRHPPASTAARRQPVYHRLNPDVFFMAADRPAGDTMSWRSRDYRHTQV